MAAVGSGTGALFSLTKAREKRVHATSQILASILVFAFASDLLVAAVPVLLA